MSVILHGISCACTSCQIRALKQATHSLETAVYEMRKTVNVVTGMHREIMDAVETLKPKPRLAWWKWILR